MVKSSHTLVSTNRLSRYIIAGCLGSYHIMSLLGLSIEIVSHGLFKNAEKGKHHSDVCHRYFSVVSGHCMKQLLGHPSNEELQSNTSNPGIGISIKQDAGTRISK